MYVDSSSGDNEDTDEDNPRVILSVELLLCFDKHFSEKRWLKLSPRTQKMISSICATKVKQGNKGKGKRSNRSLCLDRHHYLSACRGLHSLFFSPRNSFESQDSAMVDFIAIYQKTRYYKLAKVCIDRLCCLYLAILYICHDYVLYVGATKTLCC